MEAIILAGGFGTRLQKVVNDVPKPMADINGRPFLSYLMDYLSSQDISKVLLSVGYKYEIIKNYFGLKYKNLDIEYVIEAEPLGTGGALGKALKQTNENNVLVLNGDTFFNLDLKKLVDFHLAQNSILTLSLKPMHNFDRYGTAILKDNRVIGFEEKSFKIFGYINGGVYVLDRKIDEYFMQYSNNFSFEIDFLQKNILGSKPFAFISDSYFIDIGIPEDYEKAKRTLLFKTIKNPI